MAKQTLETEMELKTRRAVKAAKDLIRAVEQVGTKAKGGADKANASFGRVEQTTTKWLTSLASFGAGFLGMQKLLGVVTGIVAAQEKAIQLQSQLAGQGAAALGQVAGFAGQFGITEPRALEIVGPIAQAGGVAPGQIGGVADIAIAARSADLVGNLGPGGFSQRESDILVLITQFTQGTGTFESRRGLVRLVSALLQGQPATRDNVAKALGQIQVAFRESESANAAQFLQGAVQGVVPQLAGGISPTRALSQFSALIRTRARERGAGELSAQLARRFTSNDPAFVELGGGPEAFFRRRAEDPDALFADIFQKLLAGTTKDRDERFRRAGLSNEEIERLNLFLLVRPEFEATFEAVGEATAEQGLAVAGRFAGGPRAKLQRVGTAVAIREATRGIGKVDAATLTAIATEEQRRLAGESPTFNFMQGLLTTDVTERQINIANAIARQLELQGDEELADRFRQGFALELTPGRLEEFGDPVQRAVKTLQGNVTVQGDIVQNKFSDEQTPEGRAGTPFSRAGDPNSN